MLAAVGDVKVQRTVVLSVHGIGKRKWTTGVRVAGARGHSVYRDRQGVVQRRRFPDVVRLASNVSSRCEEARANLPFDGDVPQVDVRGLHVVAQAEERPIQGKGRVLVERDREDIGLAAADEWIVQA